jgi:hypothetical protein
MPHREIPLRCGAGADYPQSTMNTIRLLTIAALSALATGAAAQMSDGCTREYDGRLYAVTRYVYYPTAYPDYCGKPAAAVAKPAKVSRAARTKPAPDTVEK